VWAQRPPEDAYPVALHLDPLKASAWLQRTATTAPRPQAYQAWSLGLPSTMAAVIIQLMTHHEKMLRSSTPSSLVARPFIPGRGRP
jgi:hypothetical protein